MSTDQEQSLRILDNALWRIARRDDCEYEYDDVAAEDRPNPCTCPRCVAVAALQAAKSWRFHGAHWERTQSGNWPREAKMHAAWMKLLTRSGNAADCALAGILKEEGPPSARDWYVATSVVQWLATNVGMTVLEAAGFSYQQWEQDRANGELFRRRQEQAKDAEGAGLRQEASPVKASAVPQESK